MWKLDKVEGEFESWLSGQTNRAHTDHDKPLRLLDPVLVRLGISQLVPGFLLRRFNLVGGAMADEDGLAAPFDDDLCGLSAR